MPVEDWGECGLRRAAGLTVGLIGTLVLVGPWQSGTQLVSRGGSATPARRVQLWRIGYVYIGRFLTGATTSQLALPAEQLVAATVLA